jgi:hypothetical protein
MGKAKLKTTADGLLKMALKLAFVIASIAISWLYFWDIKMGCSRKSILLLKKNTHSRLAVWDIKYDKT